MAYRKWQKKKISLSIEELTKQSEGIVGVDNVNRTNLGRTRVESLKAYGTTLVNLLGKYGNFEVDSNSDGLADGWTNDATLAAVVNAMETYYRLKIFGSKSQKITLSADGEGGNYIEVNVVAGEVLFVAGYIRALSTTSTGKLIVDWRDATDTQISTDIIGTNTTKAYIRRSAVFTVPANAIKARIYTTVAGVTGNAAHFDGIQVNNFTAQGALDSIRATKYGVANWADLTKEQLEANTSYINSVASTNVEDEVASELTIENRGRNLWDNNKITNWLTDYGMYDGRDCLRLQHEEGMIYDSKFKLTTQYTLSMTVKKDSSSIGIAFLRFVYTDGTDSGYSYPLNFSEWTHVSYTTAPGKTLAYIAEAYYNIGNTYIDKSTIQLEEGTSPTDYVPPRTDSITIPDTCELHGFEGVFNYIDSNGNYIKNWERADKTTDGAGAFSLIGYKSGSKVICRNKANGEVEVLNAAAPITTSWASANIEILYRLAAAVSSNVAIRGALGDLHRGHNNFICSTQTRESFTGDGYTTVFNTTIIPTSVKVNGLAQTSGVTLGASSVTFTTAPRRKAIIEVFGAGTGGALPAINLEILDASGTVETVPALVDLSVTENEEKTGYLNVNGAPLKVAGNKTYTVTLNKDLIESQDNILEEYRDKKFRLKVQNPRDSSIEYLGVCHIDPEASLNYLNGTESINIKCGDLYD